MLKIRLSRRGRKRIYTYFVVVAEHTSPIQGKFIEKLGVYSPESKMFQIDQDRLNHWIKNGAKPSETVARLMVKYAKMKDAKKFINPLKIKDKEIPVEPVKEEVKSESVQVESAEAPVEAVVAESSPSNSDENPTV